MRLQLLIDGYQHEIDSTNPELLGRWVAEIFGRLPTIYPTTDIRVRAQPSWVPAGQGYSRGDWIADSRIICQDTRIRSPRELVAALSAQLDQAEALARGGA